MNLRKNIQTKLIGILLPLLTLKVVTGVDDDGEVIGARLTNKLKAEIVDLTRKCEPSIVVENIFQVGKVIVVDFSGG